ncbi:MAG: potassium channel family protein [Sulfuricellaceae bacterium]|nr:potassium channel family protein [Sulfuricellaceae bacterium]
MLRFWAEDRGLSIFLALLVMVIFLLPVLPMPGSVGRFVGNFTFSALLIAGAISSGQWRWMRVIVVLALLVRWAAAALSSDALDVMREASTLIMFVLFAMVVAERAYRSGPVTSHRIKGAVAVFLLLGLVWAHAYELLHLLHPEAFSGAVGSAGPQTWIYYSFVTLTTMGYGDITPVHPVARSLAISEALIGQLYVATTLARLVALQVGSGNKD